MKRLYEKRNASSWGGVARSGGRSKIKGDGGPLRAGRELVPSKFVHLIFKIRLNYVKGQAAPMADM